MPTRLQSLFSRRNKRIFLVTETMGVPIPLMAEIAAGAGRAAHWTGQQVQTQASFLADMDAFWVFALIALAPVPLALAMRKVSLGGAVSLGIEEGAARTANAVQRGRAYSPLAGADRQRPYSAGAARRNRSFSRRASPTFACHAAALAAVKASRFEATKFCTVIGGFPVSLAMILSSPEKRPF
jgi:hypothetical protein